jgi:hypothetical protein
MILDLHPEHVELSTGPSNPVLPYTTIRAEHYAIGADAAKKAILASQDKDIRANQAFHCPDCGWRRWTGYGYRCLYCGIWYCAHCAELHFGQTISDWTIAKRIEKRREIEEKEAQ